jgi:hypothetical protein
VTAARTTDRDIIDAAVVVQNIPEHKHDFDHGRWFGMFVKLTAGDDWQLIGRRRARGELLEMVKATTATAHSASGAASGAG